MLTSPFSCARELTAAAGSEESLPLTVLVQMSIFVYLCVCLALYIYLPPVPVTRPKYLSKNQPKLSFLQNFEI